MAGGVVAQIEAWLRQAGVWWDEELMRICGSAEAPSGFAMGVVATTDISEGTSLCTIPKRAVLSIKTTGIADLIEQSDIRGGLALTVAVMYEIALGRESPWFGYLETLPSREYLPIFWPREDLRLLKGTDLEGRAGKDMELTQDDYESVVPFISQHPDRFSNLTMDLKAFREAASLVASRAFIIDKEHGDAMVPLADLFNHKAAILHFSSEYIVEGQSSDDEDSDGDGSNGEAAAECIDNVPEGYPATETKSCAQTCDKEEGAQDVSVSGPRLEIAICSATEDVLEIVTASRIEQGNEIHNTYGEHSNAELLHKYGFALLSNPFNVITIAKQAVVDAMTDIMGEELCRERCELLQDNSHLLEPDDEPFEILEGGLLSAPLVVVLVVLTTHGSKFNGWESMLRTLEVGGQSIQEPKAVAAVWDLIGAVGRKFLQDTLSSRLTKYAGGSLADEKAMLQRLCDEGSRSEQKCARIGAATLRLTEKQIILDVLSLLESTRVEKAQVEPVAQINSTNHAKRRRTAYLAVD